MADLKGRVIAFLEARRAAELADLITRHHGSPLAAPCLSEVHHPDSPELAAAVEALCRDDVSVAVFFTGVGTATIFEAARHLGREAELLAALVHKQIAARGPKPVAVLRKAGVRIDLLAAPPHTSTELAAALNSWDLAGRRVAVQLYGAPNDAFLAVLTERGAEVITMSPYDWDRPADPAPVLGLLAALRAGTVDALLGTSAAQVDNLFAIAEEHGQAAGLRQALARLPVAAQGPICAAAFARAGVPVSITPPTGHMGSLVLAVATYFDEISTTAGASTPATVGQGGV